MIDPLLLFRSWHDDVRAAGLPEPDAMVLCTAPAEEQAQPVGRFVLLRGFDDRGFAFVTNLTSRKGTHLAANPHASLVFPWFPIGRQVIVTGTVGAATDEESDAYWRTRPRGSQIASSVSEQSTPIPDPSWLSERFAELERQYDGVEVPRPPHWGMLRLAPDSIEFWTQGADRMHHRVLHRRIDDGRWSAQLLSP